MWKKTYYMQEESKESKHSDNKGSYSQMRQNQKKRTRINTRNMKKAKSDTADPNHYMV